jgi:hypothetical protein
MSNLTCYWLIVTDESIKFRFLYKTVLHYWQYFGIKPPRKTLIYVTMFHVIVFEVIFLAET